MFGLGIASVLAKVGGSLGKKIYNAAKSKVINKGIDVLAVELTEKPAGLIDEWGMAVGLRISQGMKKARLGVAEDFVRDRVVQFSAAVAKGIDSDDE